MRVLTSALLMILACTGCGTTKWSDTSRTATEQLLISDAMDRAVSQLDFRALAGKTVFMDESPTKGVVDAAYLNSAIRQHLLASGCVLKEKRDEADYVLEVRAGAVGTNRHDLLFGVPATTIPTVVAVPGVPNSIPELPLAKKTEQHAIAKVSVFAYNRRTGRPVWQSGAVPGESKAKDVWVFGAGPFQRGSIYEGTEFAGVGKLDIPLVDLSKRRPGDREAVAVADEAYFVEPEEPSDPQVAQQPGDKVSQAGPKPQTEETKPAAGTDKPPVVQTGHNAPAQAAGSSTASPTAAPQVIASPIPNGAAAPTSGPPSQVPGATAPPAASAQTLSATPTSSEGVPFPSLPRASAASEPTTVMPLPPVVPAPGEVQQQSILDRFLHWRR